MIKRTYLLIPVLGLIYGCSKTTITMSHAENCLNEKTRCEEIAIDKAIKNGIVQEQLLDALGTDTHVKNNSCFQRYNLCIAAARY